jgi:hypothetical protein
MTTKSNDLFVQPFASEQLVNVTATLPDFKKVDSVFANCKQIGVTIDSSRLVVWGNSAVSLTATYKGKDNKPIVVCIKGENALRYDVAIKGGTEHIACPRDGANDYNPLLDIEESMWALAYLLGRIYLGGRNSSTLLVRGTALALSSVVGQVPSLTVRVGDKEETHTVAESTAILTATPKKWVSEYVDILETEGLGSVSTKSTKKHADKIRSSTGITL